VLGKPALEVGCLSDVSLIGGEALQKIDVLHRRPSYAKASEGILLRAL
jgi:hypothetical protein